MLFDYHIKCDTHEEFDFEIEKAKQLILQTNRPIRVCGHCSPSETKNNDCKAGDGTGGIMFCLFTPEKELIYSVNTAFTIEKENFKINTHVKDSLRNSGILVGYNNWEEHKVTHIITIPWHKHDWEYGMIGTDAEATYKLMKYEGSSLRRGKKSIDNLLVTP